MIKSIIAISCGASLGAIIRWLLGVFLNSFFPRLPLGTLVANLSGGFLVGIAIAVLANYPALSPQWRLFVITGFLGGLTTFSTFSAEVTVLAQDGQYGWALAGIAMHVGGSLLMTVLGIATVAMFNRI